MLGDKGLDTGLVAAVATNIGWVVLRAGPRQQAASTTIINLYWYSACLEWCPVSSDRVREGLAASQGGQSGYQYWVCGV